MEFEPQLRSFLDHADGAEFALSDWLRTLSDEDFVRLFHCLEDVIKGEMNQQEQEDVLVDLIRTGIAAYQAEGGAKGVDALLEEVEVLLSRFLHVVEIELMRREDLFVINTPVRLTDEDGVADLALTAKGIAKEVARSWLKGLAKNRPH